MLRKRFVLIALLALCLPAALAAAETQIDVHVISKGAKFIGSSLGGARVTIHDADTGELLASGVTAGSTGDTDRIMRQEHGRNGQLSTPGAAVYQARLELAEPRRLRFTAYGPLVQRQAANEASVTQWVVPGKDLTGGDGLLLEIPGFSVDVLAPPAHVRLGGREVEIAANVTMMCGCPIEPDGLWNADGYEVAALIKKGGEVVAEVPLAYAGSTSQFAGRWTAPETGAYQVVVYAYDPALGNTGVDQTSFIVTQ
jgi:hypothetical protein